MPKDHLHIRMERKLKEAARRYAEANFLDLTGVIKKALVELLTRQGFLSSSEDQDGSS